MRVSNNRFPLCSTILNSSVQWNKNAYFNLALTMAYFWVTLLIMFILYFFIYQVASTMEKRSRESAKKVSDIIGVSSATMTNLVLSMSKNPRLTHTPLSSFSSCRSKCKKLPQQASISSLSRPQTSVDEEAGSSFVHHNRFSSGLDVLNRSSSNETSGELTSVASIAPNLTSLLSITHIAAVGSLKRLDENRVLSSTSSMKTTISTNSKSKATQRHNTSKARKALRTITIILGAFVICWTPVCIDHHLTHLLFFSFSGIFIRLFKHFVVHVVKVFYLILISFMHVIFFAT